MLAARRSVTQEQIITELRQFIEVNFYSEINVMDVDNEVIKFIFLINMQI